MKWAPGTNPTKIFWAVLLSCLSVGIILQARLTLWTLEQTVKQEEFNTTRTKLDQYWSFFRSVFRVEIIQQLCRLGQQIDGWLRWRVSYWHQSVFQTRLRTFWLLSVEGQILKFWKFYPFTRCKAASSKTLSYNFNTNYFEVMSQAPDGMNRSPKEHESGGCLYFRERYFYSNFQYCCVSNTRTGDPRPSRMAHTTCWLRFILWIFMGPPIILAEFFIKTGIGDLQVATGRTK